MNQLWDEHQVRYCLIHSNASTQRCFNWLFFPGGPGIDSSYFSTLSSQLHLPGNVWYVDFPNNGSNHIEQSNPRDFDTWLTLFISAVSRFENPVYVGHSFAAMLPLLYPELEYLLKGIVLIGAVPSLWFEVAAKMAQAKGLPDLTPVMTAYMQNPCQETFNNANHAVARYYFTEDVYKESLELLENTTANPYGPFWWMSKVVEIKYRAQWVPQHIPALIMNGSEDAVTPFSLFAEDKRFHRANIQLQSIPGTAHFPWLGKGAPVVKKLFMDFITKLEANHHGR